MEGQHTAMERKYTLVAPVNGFIVLTIFLLGFTVGYACSTLILCDRLRDEIQYNNQISYITLEDERMLLKECDCPDE